MKNRIQYTVTSQQLEVFNKALTTAKQVLSDIMQTAQRAELTSSQNMGTEEGWLYVQRGYAAVEKYPQLVDPEELDIAEYKKDIELAHFILRARVETKQLEEWANIIFQLVGKDLMEQTNYVRQRAHAKRQLNLDYAGISDELNRLFERRRAKADETRKTNEAIKQLKNPKFPTE